MPSPRPAQRTRTLPARPFMTVVAEDTPEIDVAYLSSLPDRRPVSAHLAAYGRMVAEAAMIRELDVHAHRIAQGAADLIRRRAVLRPSGKDRSPSTWPGWPRR